MDICTKEPLPVKTGGNTFQCAWRGSFYLYNKDGKTIWASLHEHWPNKLNRDQFQQRTVLSRKSLLQIDSQRQTGITGTPTCTPESLGGWSTLSLKAPSDRQLFEPAWSNTGHFRNKSIVISYPWSVQTSTGQQVSGEKSIT